MHDPISRSLLMRSDKFVWTRGVLAVLGAWVVVATLLWSPATATTINGVAIGALIAVAAVFALRPVDVILAVWLFASTFFVPHNDALVVSNMIAALAVLFIALPPNLSRRVVRQEWPDVAATEEHEVLAPPVDLVDDGRRTERGTMW
jgi:hypothetical protein